ncbi:hypothetical protein POX_d04924 [Penicillium oxalicum]|uniref:hypothetical protein n=1 Tax=Penicillium oxalicum TaxID=69781 RepID=UPI0020B8C764|nr:hypothetical protein POX_d04924 [Penicillium oxalicum]KAI2789435.1 hypothetical protein POX_d04924 [Penicillium oxalicum]
MSDGVSRHSVFMKLKATNPISFFKVYTMPGGLRCQFPAQETRVTVSERSVEALATLEDWRTSLSHVHRYLRMLETQLSQRRSDPESGNQLNSNAAGECSVETESDIHEAHFDPALNQQTEIDPQQSGLNGPDPESGCDEDRMRFHRNPLVDKDPSFARTPDGRFWYMGPTSSWSFCRRVIRLIGRCMPDSNCPPDPWHLDGMAFKLQWTPLPPHETPDVTNLPPLDYALFLFNTVKYHFGFLSFMIDEAVYLRNLHDFYQNPRAKAASARYWYVEYLLVLAFGKAFLGHKNASGAPSGHQYASRAMALLPDLSGMDEDPLMCIQALSLGAVYLQSIDMRRAAFQHIGQALRGCVIEGIHRHVPEEFGGLELSKRCSTIFWVVYMLDREFSALIGAPSSIRDEDITVRLPAEVGSSVEHVNLTLHVRLSRLMAQILTTVYGVGEEFDGALIQNTQSILNSMAQLSQDLTSFLSTNFHGLISRASKMAIRLVLAHHHCIVLTTRPLVMCALNMHIKSNGRDVSHSIDLTPTVASLLQCCADSAQTILQTLQTLADDDLLDAFLPFQIEDASSSAFVLYLIQAIAPSIVQRDAWRDHLNCVLNALLAKGNPAAPLRRKELRQLEQILAPITPKSTSGPIAGDNAVGDFEFESFNMDDAFEWELLGFNSSVSLPPQELSDLADQLAAEGIVHSAGTAMN